MLLAASGHCLKHTPCLHNVSKDKMIFNAPFAANDSSVCDFQSSKLLYNPLTIPSQTASLTSPSSSVSLSISQGLRATISSGIRFWHVYWEDHQNMPNLVFLFTIIPLKFWWSQYLSLVLVFTIDGVFWLHMNFFRGIQISICYLVYCILILPLYLFIEQPPPSREASVQRYLEKRRERYVLVLCAFAKISAYCIYDWIQKNLCHVRYHRHRAPWIGE